MKKLVSLLLTLSLLLTFTCSNAQYLNEPSFKGMNDPTLREYISDTLYDELVSGLDNDEYFVSDVQAIYISQEYLDELEYNSQTNRYFGYSLEELDARFQGTRYVFTLGDNGETLVKEFESYDDVYGKMIQNVAIGTGVILLCVTVSVVSAGLGAPAVSMIFAVAADTATTCALSGAALGGLSSGIVTAFQTGNINEALQSAALGASEGFKWGAITGAITGGVAETAGLYGATMNGLTMNEAALIQMDTNLPLAFIRNMHSLDEYNLYKGYGLDALKLNDTYAYYQFVDLTAVDADGVTNLERIIARKSPVDPDGIPYELHHIGQASDSPLAILTHGQHHDKDAFSILHANTGDSPSIVERGSAWENEKHEFWITYALALLGEL